MRYTLLGVAALVAVVAAVVDGESAPAQTTGATTLTFDELDKGAQFHFVDNPPHARTHRPGLADEFTVANILADASGAHIGRLNAECTVSDVSKSAGASFVCTGVFKLKDGMLFLQAVSTERGKTTAGAVTGGTGAYANARGTFTSVQGRTGSHDTVTLAG